MKITAYVSHEDTSRHDTGWNHPDHQGRLPAVTRAVYREMPDFFEPLLQVEGVPADEEVLRLVHTTRYLDDLRRTSIAAAAEGRTLELGGVPVSGATWEAVRAASGSVLTAVERVLTGEVRNAFVPARPPGRDALPDGPGGHSLVNHVALAARRLRARQGSARVLVVAWGVDAPVALRECVRGDPGITVLGIHTHAAAEPHPRDRSVSTGADAAVAQGDALGGVEPGDLPDFVLLSAGLDLFEGAGQGGAESIYAATRALREWVDDHAGGRLVVVLEGGWDAQALGAGVVRLLRALIGLPA